MIPEAMFIIGIVALRNEKGSYNEILAEYE